MKPRIRLQGSIILVTGGAGFIGSHLVDALIREGGRVRVLDDFSSGSLSNLPPDLAGVELVEGDIRDLEICRAACEGARFVFHQAALGSVPRSMKAPASAIEVNVLGTTNVLTAARDAAVQRVVYASSSSVYGDSQTLPKREGQEGRPLSPYALSKVQCEGLADVFGRCFGLETVGLRYFNVYGPRQSPEGPYAAVIPRFVTAAQAGDRPTIYGDGSQSRDFTWVGDVVAANLLAAEAPAAACGRAYNVAAGCGTSVLELWKKLSGVLESSAEPSFEPARQGDVLHSVADPSLAADQLGFNALMPIGEGLAKTVDAYRGNGVRS